MHQIWETVFKEANHKFTLPSDEAAAIEQSHKALMWPLCHETNMLTMHVLKKKKKQGKKRVIEQNAEKGKQKRKMMMHFPLTAMDSCRANQLTYTIISFICSAHLLRNSFMGHKGPQRVKTYLITLLHKWKKSPPLQHAKLGYFPC